MFYFNSDPNWSSVRIQDLLDNPLESSNVSHSLIRVPAESRSLNQRNVPGRMTGNAVVDSFLHEILELVLKDYVTVWYDVVSENRDFINSIKYNAETLIKNLSNRVKYAEWMPFFTGRLVENVTNHLRLFRASNNTILSTVQRRTSATRGSPARSPARNMQHHRRNKSDTDASAHCSLREYHPIVEQRVMSVEDQFFQLETDNEQKKINRKTICTNYNIEQLFLNELTQLILYMSVDGNELKARTTQSALRAICSTVLQAAFHYITDPDAINILTMRTSWREAFSNESFISVLKTTQNLDELKATLDLVKLEIEKLISCDLVGECDISVKQQLSSLQYLVKMLENRTSVLTPTTNVIITTQTREFTEIGLEFLLENHLGLGHFLDYAICVGAHSFIPCYLNIQAWKVAVLKFISPEMTLSPSDRCDDLSIRVVAKSIYDQYLSSASPNTLNLPSEITNKVALLISRPISVIDVDTMYWFEEVEGCIQKKLDGLLLGFRESNQYVKLLAELGFDGMNFSEKSNEGKKLHGSKSSLSSLTSTDDRIGKPLSASQESIEKWIIDQEPCFIDTVIVETGLTQEHGKWFGIYAIEVTRRKPTSNKQHCWHVYRRYSDFHDLYAIIKENFPELSKIPFPSKKTFHNTSRSVLEQRKVVLNKWLSTLAMLGAPGGPTRYSSIHSNYLIPFLKYERQQSVGKLDSMLVQPLKQGMKTLKNVPGQLINTVDDIVGGLSKVIAGSSNSKHDAAITRHSRLETAVAASFDFDMSSVDSEELPLRVVLTLLDEVFELKQQNRWLRRQIAGLLRQLMTSMFANVLNRRIVEYVTSITSPATMVYILDGIKYKFWSDAAKADSNLIPRSAASKARTRVAVKTFLLSISQDRLKHIIGSQTTHKGVLTIFHMFQSPTLNKRLLYVLVEDILNALYPDSNIKQVFQQILEKQEELVS